MNLKPNNQTNLYGYSKYFNDLISLYNENKFPNKILLSGEKGIGKSTLAYHFINYILSLNENFSYDLKNSKISIENKSFKLIQNKSNPNFILIDLIEEKKRIDINQIRELILKLNKSSFNSKPRFILIDNIEYLNVNSINALLKILEEPNEGIYFILINNNKYILPTLKSRCLNYKISFTYNEILMITKNILNQGIFDFLNKDLVCYYGSPGHFFDIINYTNKFEIDAKNTNLKELLSILIRKKFYKKEVKIKELIYYFIELYFRNNISLNNLVLFESYNYFLKKIDKTKSFNLDEESLFIEFEDKVLNG